MSHDRNRPAFPVSEEHNEAGITLLEYMMAKVDVSPYRPMESLSAKLGRQPTIIELAEYIVQIRKIEAVEILKVSR